VLAQDVATTQDAPALANFHLTEGTMPATLARDDTKALKGTRRVWFSAAGIALARAVPARAQATISDASALSALPWAVSVAAPIAVLSITVDSVFRWLERDGLGGPVQVIR
jgi:hypothetical protein